MALIALVEHSTRSVIPNTCLCASHDTDHRRNTVYQIQAKDMAASWMYVRGGFCWLGGCTDHTDQNVNYPNAGSTYAEFYNWEKEGEG